MCLIICKPKGVKVSDFLYKAIEEGMRNNSDGAGFAFKRGGANVVVLDKGYYSHIGIANKIKATMIMEDDELLIHCRWATHGSKNGSNTQPFAVSKEDSYKLNAVGSYPALAHNGIMANYYFKTSESSDSRNFVEKFLCEKSNHEKFLKNPEEVLRKNSESEFEKFGILFPNRDLLTYGSFTQDKGYYFSNHSYKSYSTNSYERPTALLLTEKVDTSKLNEERTINFTTSIPEIYIENVKKFFGIGLPINSPAYNDEEKVVDQPYCRIRNLTDGKNTKEKKDYISSFNVNLSELLKDGKFFIDKSNYDELILEVHTEKGSDEVGQTAVITNLESNNTKLYIRKKVGVATSVIEWVDISYIKSTYNVFPADGHKKDYMDFAKLVSKIGYSKSAYKKLIKLYSNEVKTASPLIYLKSIKEYFSKKAFRIYFRMAPMVVTTIHTDNIDEPVTDKGLKELAETINNAF